MENYYIQLAQAGPSNAKSSQIQTKSIETSTSVTGKKDAPPGAPPQSNPLGSMLWTMLPIIAIFYFLLIRPQKKREKQKKEMLNRLVKGDKVITKGGIWGVVLGVRNDEGKAIIKIAEKVKVEVSISAIETVNPEKVAQSQKETTKPARKSLFGFGAQAK